MNGRSLSIIAAAGSAGLLAGAFLFQFLGYPPCAMCLWQRWPHAAAILIGVMIVAVPNRFLALVGALAAFATAAIGIFHTGVERDLWEGPTSCTGGGLDTLSGSDLLSTEGPRVVMCDVVSWELLGLSMASWNALFSLCLCAIWVLAFRRL